MRALCMTLACPSAALFFGLLAVASEQDNAPCAVTMTILLLLGFGSFVCALIAEDRARTNSEGASEVKAEDGYDEGEGL